MTSFLKWNYNIFISSLKKINLNIILLIILDALFYFTSGFLVIIWLKRIQAKITSFNLPNDITPLGLERVQQLVSDARAFYFLVILSFILIILAIIFLASILKGIIWAKTTKTRISFNFISKFLLLNLIWMGFWFALIFLVSFLVEPASYSKSIIVIIVLGLYFTNTLYTIFMKRQKLKAIFSAVKLNIAKIHLFILPYTAIALVFFAIIKLSNLIKFRYSEFLFNFLILFYIAVIRYYVSTLVLEMDKT